jgi:hypothetical protein
MCNYGQSTSDAYSTLSCFFDLRLSPSYQTWQVLLCYRSTALDVCRLFPDDHSPIFLLINGPQSKKNFLLPGRHLSSLTSISPAEEAAQSPSRELRRPPYSDCGAWRRARQAANLFLQPESITASSRRRWRDYEAGRERRRQGTRSTSRSSGRCHTRWPAGVRRGI